MSKNVEYWKNLEKCGLSSPSSFLYRFPVPVLGKILQAALKEEQQIGIKTN